MTFDEVTPDLRSDAIIGCLIQSLNVKLITFFNQSQRRADPLTQGTFAMRIIVSYLPLQWIDYQFRKDLIYFPDDFCYLDMLALYGAQWV